MSLFPESEFQRAGRNFGGAVGPVRSATKSLISGLNLDDRNANYRRLLNENKFGEQAGGGNRIQLQSFRELACFVESDLIFES